MPWVLSNIWSHVLSQMLFWLFFYSGCPKMCQIRWHYDRNHYFCSTHMILITINKPALKTDFYLSSSNSESLLICLYYTEVSPHFTSPLFSLVAVQCLQKVFILISPIKECYWVERGVTESQRRRRDNISLPVFCRQLEIKALNKMNIICHNKKVFGTFSEQLLLDGPFKLINAAGLIVKLECA